MKVYRVTYEELDVDNPIIGIKYGVRHIAQYQLSDEQLRLLDKYHHFDKANIKNDIRTKLIEELKQKIKKGE